MKAYEKAGPAYLAKVINFFNAAKKHSDKNLSLCFLYIEGYKKTTLSITHGQYTLELPDLRMVIKTL
ncbi:hypothetical protein [Desulfoscipio gibsoniae]|uniref:hypothetical protein n=1 Tax=Desulfoscipio gibsoniae TaxID=102134 RepID=UPI00059C7878|nr:hypothetical protein [Desulfoscipio gibsoniae]